MKLIQLASDHYIVVEDTEVKENDWYIDDANTIRKAIMGDGLYWAVRNGYKKITHSTKPINTVILKNRDHSQSVGEYYGSQGKIEISEVKELLGIVDVEKKAYDVAFKFIGTDFQQVEYLKSLIIEFYNQCLEDNKDKKYTEEDVIRIVEKSRETGFTAEYIMLSLQPKTQWEVEFIDGKLKLK